VNIWLFASILTGFALTYLVIPPIVRVSNVKQLFDVPNERKLNKVMVPTLGGVAIFIGLLLTSTVLMRNDNPDSGLRYLFAGVIIMFFVGLKDDLVILSARKKLAIQILATLILVVLGHFRITNPYGLFSLYQLDNWISIPLSVMVILFLMNALNLIDGIDGLAAGISLLVTTALGIWFSLCGHINYAIPCMALCGSLIAFLRFNLWGGKNKIFMGDTGSLVLGIFISAMTIKFNEVNAAAPANFQFAQAPLIAMALVIVPVTDTLRVFAIRIWHKRSPFSPDMNHFHHLLIKSGLSHIQATCFLIIYTTSFVVIALAFSHFQINITGRFTLLLALSFSCVGLIYLITRRVTLAKLIIENKKLQVKIIRLQTQPSLSNILASDSDDKEKPYYHTVEKRTVLQMNNE